MKYIKLFNSSAEYETFISGDQFVTPNISFIPTERLAKYSPIPKPPKVTLNYNCPEDNLLAFSNVGGNIKALTVDGINIDFPPVVSGTFSIEINADKVNIDMASELIEFPDKYVLTSAPTSLIIKPKGDSVKITDVANGLILFASAGGGKMCELMPFSGMDGMFVVDEVNNQLICSDAFLRELEGAISMGYYYGFGLCNITNIDKYEFTIIDCLQIYEGFSGGVKTPYSFDTPGQHTVEMELFTGDFGGMHMFANPATEQGAALTSVVFNELITSIAPYTFVYNNLLTEITCKSKIAPTVENSFNGIPKFGKLYYPEGSDYSSWLENENGLARYYWNKEQPIMTAKYNITDTSANTKLCNSTDDFTDMVIDGQTVPLSTGYTFNTLGEHTVAFKLSSLGISYQAFSNCSRLASIVIPDSVTSIGYQAFYGCTSLPVIGSIRYADTYLIEATDSTLATYNIKEGTKFIGDRAFSYCTGLTSIVIPDSVTSIGSYAFSNCSRLTSVNIPDSVTSIGGEAFYACSGLASIIVSSGNTTYDSRENCNCIIKTATNNLILGCKNSVIPNGVTSIGNSAFYGCSGLASIVIPDSVRTIGDYVFFGCSGLASIVIPNSVTYIGYRAFQSCSGLTDVTIGSGVTEIDSNAFSDCTGLASIIIPDSVKTIRSYAFSGCEGLTSITCLASTAPTIDYVTFYDIRSNGTLYVPAGSDYSSWMSTNQCYLGYYNWTRQEITTTN